MKKILLATALVLAIGLSVSAQDGFFRGGYDDSGDRGTSISATKPRLPGDGVGVNNDDQPAPIGGGLLVLTALGAGYAVTRRREK